MEENRAEALMRETGAFIFERFITGAEPGTTPVPRQMPPFAS
jgi:hypothetical protein